MNTITLNTVSLNRVSPNRVQLNSTGGGAKKKEKIDYIKFADPEVERICLANFDTNGDGKIQFEEASAVTTFVDTFKNNKAVKTFNEIQYFDNPRCNINNALNGSGITEFVGGLNAGVVNSLFAYCNKLNTVNVREVRNAVSMDYIFTYASSLRSAKLNNLKNVTSLNYAFRGCSILEELEFDNIRKVSSMNNSFLYCEALKSFKCEALPNTNISFGDCKLLTLASVENIINALPDSTTYPTLTLHVDAIDRYEEVHEIESVEDACIEKGWMLAESGTRKGIAFADAEAKRVMLGLFDDNGDGNIDAREAKAEVSCEGIFNKNKVVASFDEGISFVNVTSWKSAFNEASNITSIKLAGTIVNLADTFRSCSALSALDVSKANISNVNTVYRTFSNCYLLTKIDLAKMKAIGTCAYAFYNCSRLSVLALGDWSKVTAMTSTFNACRALEDIEVTYLPDVDISLNVSNLLSVESVSNIILALPQSAKGSTLTLHADAKARYDAINGEEACEDAVIDKGWILA